MKNVITCYYYKKPNFLPLPEWFFEGTWKVFIIWLSMCHK